MSVRTGHQIKGLRGRSMRSQAKLMGGMLFMAKKTLALAIMRLLCTEIAGLTDE